MSFRIQVMQGTSVDGEPLGERVAVALGPLVAHGPGLVDGNLIASDGTGAARRMALSRLRDALWQDALPKAINSQYELRASDDCVDLWCLRAAVKQESIGGISDEQLLHLLRPDPEIQGLSQSDLAEQQTEIRRNQHFVLALAEQSRPELLSGLLFDLLESHLTLDPFNEHLVVMAAKARARRGDRDGAISVVRSVAEMYESKGRLAPDVIQRLESDLLNGLHGPSHEFGPPPNALGDLCEAASYVGFDELRADLRRSLTSGEHRSIIVTGPSGAGKTRLIAEVATSLGEGWDIYYFSAPQFGRAALGALLSTLPELGSRISGVLGRDLDDASRRAEMLTQAWAAIEDRSGSRDVVCVFDDAQWLDSYSQEFAQHVMSTGARGKVKALIASTSVSAIAELLAMSERGGGQHHEIGKMDVGVFEELIASHVPAWVGSGLRHRAETLHHLSGALLGVGVFLLGLPEEIFDAPTAYDLAEHTPLANLVYLLEPLVRRVGQVSSVIGPQTSAESVAEIADLKLGAVEDCLNALVSSGLFVRTHAGSFQPAHMLVAAGFISTTNPADLQSWNLQCAAQYAPNIHAEAEYLYNANEESTRVVEALLNSAELFSEHGLFAESIRDAERALRRSFEHERLADFDAKFVAALARSYDMHGRATDALQLRREFAEEERRAMPAELIDVLTSSLPEVEPVSGQPWLVGKLESLGDVPLDDHHRWKRAVVIARQEAILGNPEIARSYIEAGAKSSSTAREKFETVVIESLLASTVDRTSERLHVANKLTRSSAGLSQWHRAEALALSMVDHYEAAMIDQACDYRRELGDIEARSHIRRWHAMLFDSMHAWNLGLLEGASRLRKDALDYAQFIGIAEALNAYLTGELAELALFGGAEVLADVVESGMVTESDSLLAVAAFALADSARGRADDAVERAVRVASAATTSPSPLGTPALALVARILAGAEDQAVVSASRELLELGAGGLIVAGASAACLGPTDLYLAHLAPTVEQQRELFSRAVDLSDRLELKVWQVLCRVERGSRDDLRTAEELVGDGELFSGYQRLIAQ